MGNTDSIPLISQFKSLVQVINGDAAAARKTQENFARQGILVSQLNSLGHSIAGNNREAERIQEDFGKAQLDIAKNLPVVGHGIAAGYAIGGDTEEAGKIAIDATGTTLDLISDFGNGRKRKRSIDLDNDLVYDMTLPDLPADWKPKLPGKYSEMAISDNLSTEAIVANTISFIFVLKLLSIGHVASKPYVKEICENRYTHLAIEDCSWMFVEAMRKFENNEVAKPSDFMIDTKENPNLLLADTLVGLDFEVRNLNEHTLIGHLLKVFACQNSTNRNECYSLITYLEEKLDAIQSLINHLKTKNRKMRGNHNKKNGWTKKIKKENPNETLVKRDPVPAKTPEVVNKRKGFVTYRKGEDTQIGGDVDQTHFHVNGNHAKFSDAQFTIGKNAPFWKGWMRMQDALENLDLTHKSIPNYVQYKKALEHVRDQHTHPKPKQN